MASFYTRKNGSITAKIRRHGITKSATFATKTAAEAWSRKVESEIERGRWHDTTEAERTTIGELVAEYRKRMLPNLR
ncbi:MAG: site-specific integrase, partial [Gammaproteobacteria bacterium]